MILNKKGKCIIIWGADFETKLILSALPVDILRHDEVRWFFMDTVTYYMQCQKLPAFPLSKIMSFEDLDLLV